MRKGLIIALTISFLAGCLGDEVNELEFFEVSLQQVKNAAELGTVELTGVLIDDENITIEEHGFIWASTVSALENLTAETQWITRAGAPESAAFTATATGFSLDSVYYFRAYAIAGERRALSSIFTFSMNVNIGISREVFIYNDSVVLTGFIQGLQQPDVNISISEHGFVFSETNTFPVYGMDNTIPLEMLNDDGPFQASETNLEFNQRYFVRAFVKPQGQDPYYSDTLSFRMADGWKIANDFPLALFYASSASANGKGYVVFGCRDDVCAARSSKLWEYIPETDSWNEKAPFDKFLPTRYNATAFAIRDTLYVGFGKDPDPISGIQSYAHDFYWIAPNGSNTWMELDNQPPSNIDRREGAFAFVIADKAYTGGGRKLDGTALNDLWQYDPNARTWKPMARLQRYTNNLNRQEYGGRFEAVAFEINGKGYVGTGADAAYAMRDFWEYTPPVTSQDTGHWEWHSFMPGPARFVAYGFSIGERGYVGGGKAYDNSYFFNDHWEFNPSLNGDAAWTAVTSFEGERRGRAFGFAAGGRGFVGGGETRVLNENNIFITRLLKSFWAYTPRQ